MPRIVTKTYGPKAKDTFASRAFDEAILKDKGGGRSSTATKAASTIQRWGNTSFTSTRGNVDGAEIIRKRKVEPEPETSVADSLFDDPFSFDCEDAGPKKPKRGMGYKSSDDPLATGTKAAKAPGSSKLKRDENNEEKDTMKNAPKSTYSKVRLAVSKPSGLDSSDNSSSSRAKQLSIEAFTTKLQPHNSQTSKQSALPASSSGGVRKFFTSRGAKSSAGASSDLSNSQASSSQHSKASALFEDDEDEYDSDYMANLDSGDPEVIFNSPQRRAREQQDLEKPDSPVTVSSSGGDIAAVGAESDHDHDTDSVCSSQSQGSSSQPRGKFFKSYSRPTSLTSNGSNGSLYCDKLKWDNRPMMKISSLDREEKEKKNDKPVVRRLLTSSPSKVSVDSSYLF